MPLNLSPEWFGIHVDGEPRMVPVYDLPEQDPDWDGTGTLSVDSDGFTFTHEGCKGCPPASA